MANGTPASRTRSAATAMTTEPAPTPTEMTPGGQPRRTIGLLTAVTIIMGAMIGSGILILPADMLAILPSPMLVMVIFVVAAILTILGSLTVAELSGMYPKAGGQYVYLREAFGPFPAYLFGWTNFWVIQTGTIAAVAAAFAKILDVILARAAGLPEGVGYLPGHAAKLLDIGPIDIPYVLHLDKFNLITLPPYGQAFVAIAIILLLTGINYLGVRFGGLVSNVSTIAKAIGLLLVVLLVVVFYDGPSHFDAPDLMHADGALFTTSEAVQGFAAALLLILFAYDGWYMATYVAHEMRNPRRDGPLALALAPLATTAIYLAVAGASLYVVSVGDAIAIHDSGTGFLAGKAAALALGPEAEVAVSLIALVAVFGTVNAYVLTAPRIAYAQAREGLFLRSMARLDPKRGTPAYGSLLCGLWASILVMSGLYYQLVASVVFAVFLFHILTAAAWFVLRRTATDVARPFRVPGGPVIPALFGLTSLAVVVATLYFPDYRPQAVLELLIILVGVPFYFVQRLQYPGPEGRSAQP